MTFMSNQLLNEAEVYGPVIKVDNHGTESEISSSCQLSAHRVRQALHFLLSVSVSRKWTQSFKQKEEFAINDVFDFGPSDLQMLVRRPQFLLLNGFSVYPQAHLLCSPSHFPIVLTKEKNMGKMFY